LREFEQTFKNLVARVNRNSSTAQQELQQFLQPLLARVIRREIRSHATDKQLNKMLADEIQKIGPNGKDNCELTLQTLVARIVANLTKLLIRSKSSRCKNHLARETRRHWSVPSKT
jgi:hypothetical protein